MSSHSHHNHPHDSHSLPIAGKALGRVFYWAIGLNLVYVAVEAAMGLAAGSMGLLSDAGHNLSDVASLLLAFIALKAAQRHATPRFTYGYGKATVEASFINAVILYVAVIFIFIESVEKLFNPSAVNGDVVAWVAGIGVAINGLTAWMLLRHSGKDLNVKGAYLHMVADTLVSVGVVVSGLVIQFTGWTVIDPIVGIAIALLIAITSYSQMRDSLRMVLDGVPAEIDVESVKLAILSVPGVESMHHLHIWPVSTTVTAMTVHVIVTDASLIDSVIAGVRRATTAVGIGHSTIEAETAPNCTDAVHS